jgi:hypothetical protein
MRRARPTVCRFGIRVGMLRQAEDGSWSIPQINLDGTAGVHVVVWKAPPPRALNTPPDPSVTMFINDQQFITFKMPPNANRLFGLAAQTEGNTYQSPILRSLDDASQTRGEIG